jgi:hypothetical protein
MRPPGRPEDVRRDGATATPLLRRRPGPGGDRDRDLDRDPDPGRDRDRDLRRDLDRDRFTGTAVQVRYRLPERLSAIPIRALGRRLTSPPDRP